GDFSKRISKQYLIGSKNEVTSLSKSMNKMTDEIEKLTTNLKNEVESQTKEIQLQNDSFFNLLSNLDQGFLILNARGEISGKSTEITKEILGCNPSGCNVTDVFQLNFTEKKAYHKWLEHLFNNKMPFKDLLPLGKKSLDDIDGKEISLIYKPIYGKLGKNKLEKLICIIKDMTKEKSNLRKIKLAHEKSDMVLKLIDSPIEFLDILSEIQYLIDSFLQNSKSSKFDEVFRSFHTLKARFANYKISVIVKSIHAVEEDLFTILKFKEDMQKNAKKPDLFEGSLNSNDKYTKIFENIELKVYRLSEDLKKFLKENRKVIELAQTCVNSSDQVEELHEAKRTVLKFNEIITERFVLKNIKDYFMQYEKTVSELSGSLDKNVELIIGDTDINIRLEYYKDFLSSLHHVFRNSLDHGIEDKEERIAQNKKEKAVIEVVFKRKGFLKFQIAIKDDGRGIDPLKIRNLASKKVNLSHLKLNNMTPNQIIQLIFEPGFSSMEETTIISGRGIGMDAVKSCVNDLEGTVWVESEIGEGTLFVAELPIIR
ncbi:ATP-binding protein, partial [Bacteriovoracales bacterium]|nr:ATP-binding protein [Bacteriovoracales bacterium]